MNIKPLCIATTLAFGLTATGATLAQQAPPPPPPATQAPAAPANVPDKDLEKFAEAQHEVLQIRSDFTAKAEAEADAEQLQSLQAEANQKMTKAVDEAGLDVQSYNQIAMAVQSNPELQGKVQQLMAELD